MRTIPAGIAALARNCRLNNPGNVDRTSIVWQGMSALQDDPRFIRFVAPQWGFRCMARILLGDFREGCVTVHALIDRWAPPVENDTSAYVTDVAERMTVGIDETLTLPDRLLPLLQAIAIHEGGCPWADATIQWGIDLERHG
jgi:hypothetical protein